MPRPRTFDEQEVLDKAMDVFCRHGYDGSTMAELTDAMGVTAPSIYAAWESKRGLFEAVLDRYADSQSERRAWILAAPTAREVAERMLFGAADLIRKKKGPSGSLLIQGGLAAGPDNSEVPAILARKRRADELALRERFDRAKATGDLSGNVDTTALASFVTTVFDGLSVRAAAGASAEEIRKVARQALMSWPASTGLPKPASEPDAPPQNDTNDTPRGPGRPREFNASEALDAAMEVFWRKGYEGASLGDLTDAMGITRPSLYATFGNKESLFLKALDHYQRVHLAYGSKALQAPTARAFVEEMLAGAVAVQTSDAHPRGCLKIINSMQGGDEARGIRAELLRRAVGVHDVIVARLVRAKAEGELPASADPEGLARLLYSVLQGIATLGAAGASPEQLHDLVTTTLAIWPTK